MRALNLKKWIDDNRDFLKPPVGNKRVWKDSEFIVMMVGGPNARTDFHVNQGEEFFYQIEGDITLKIVNAAGKIEDIIIKEGEMFLLPPRIPHGPMRGEGTVGLVIERERREDEEDGLQWYCEKCETKLYEEFFHLEDIEKQFQGVFKRFFSNDANLICKNCNHHNPKAKGYS